MSVVWGLFSRLLCHLCLFYQSDWLPGLRRATAGVPGRSREIWQTAFGSRPNPFPLFCCSLYCTFFVKSFFLISSLVKLGFGLQDVQEAPMWGWLRWLAAVETLAFDKQEPLSAASHHKWVCMNSGDFGQDLEPHSGSRDQGFLKSWYGYSVGHIMSELLSKCTWHSLRHADVDFTKMGRFDQPNPDLVLAAGKTEHVARDWGQ